MEYPRFKVCTRCFTFNQAKYITDTMNGFTMQKTDFPFVCCIVDDASTDGEQKVILEYLRDNFDLSEGSVYYQKETDYAQIAYARHKTNSNCYFAVLLLKENHYSMHKPKMQYLSEWADGVPYEAMCEGDDYWVDPDKLQKQAKILDSDARIGVCYSNFNILYSKTGKEVINAVNSFPQRYPMKYKSIVEFIVSKAYVCPPSWLYRRELYLSCDYPSDCCDGTFCEFAYFMNKSKVFYLDDVTSTYRVVEESASHSKSPERSLKRRKDLLALQKYLINYYGLPSCLSDECEIRYYRDNLLFFAENHFIEELDNARKVLTPVGVKANLLIKIGEFKSTSKLLKFIHEAHNSLHGYY